MKTRTEQSSKTFGLLILLVFLVGLIIPYPAISSTSTQTNSGTWQATTLTDAPAGRYGHTAIWTGEKLIIWGGYYHLDNFLSDGHGYDPGMDQWSEISSTSAPTGRLRHTAVWTGTEMIVWGGEVSGGGATTNTGGRYDPSTDTWSPTSLIDAPDPREMHSAVWTGSKMIVWGGCSTVSCNTVYNDGGIYDPATDTWTPIDPPLGLAARNFHQAVWTGSKMLVWGGTSNNQGVSYDPVMDIWALLSTNGAPVSTYQGTSVWTGTEMIVWGGCTLFSKTPCNSYENSGGSYNPATDTWTPLPTIGAPTARWTHSAVWTGTYMLIWGGCGVTCYNTGGAYDPTTGFWSPLETIDAPEARSNHFAAWVGDEMIVWGGCDVAGCGDVNYFDSGGRYIPPITFPTPTPSDTSTLSPPTFTPTVTPEATIGLFDFLPVIIKEPTLTPTPTITPTSTLTATLVQPSATPKPTSTNTPAPNCHPSYPTVCIPPPPPDLDCADIPYRNFPVLPPDPHNFDGDNDGIGCET